MKPYIQGLITGILLTVSAMMFMGAQDPRLDRIAIMYDNDDIMRKLKKIERNVSWMKINGVECN
jgi:hypothetical protein